MSRNLLLVPLILLAGCASHPYTAPVSGKTASLEIILLNTYLLDFSQVVIGDSLWGIERLPFMDPNGLVLEHKTDDKKPESDKTAITTKIAASQKVSMIFYGKTSSILSGTKECVLKFSFMPEEGAYYVFTGSAELIQYTSSNIFAAAVNFIMGHNSATDCAVSIKQRVNGQLIPVKVDMQ